MKKTISLAISLILVFAIFAGCGKARNMTAPQAAPAAPMATRVEMAPNASTGGMGATPKFNSLVSAVGEKATADLEQTQALYDQVLGEEADYQMQHAYETAVDADMAPPAQDGGVAGPSVKQVVDSRKIIKNVDMRLQTQSFDTSVEAIPKIAESFDGFVQDSYVEGRDMYNERGTRNANFTIRIPVEKLDSFIGSVGSEFHVISKSQNSQDITDSYYDSKARLDALKIQEERLLEMLKQAAELEYLLQVEKELMNVRYEIESLTSSLNRMDSYVSMSTVTIYLQEVIKYDPVEDVPVSFGERISRAFAESWKSFGEFSQSFAVGFVAALPFLLVLAVIVIIIIAIIRKAVKRGEEKRAESFSTTEASAPSDTSRASRIRAARISRRTRSASPESDPNKEPPTDEEKR